MKNITITKLLNITAIASIALAVQSVANAAQSYNFKTKGVTISFTLDAPLESIGGTTNGVTGSVVFDINNPNAIEGSIKWQHT